jgi:hypothetical protein
MYSKDIRKVRLSPLSDRIVYVERLNGSDMVRVRPLGWYVQNNANDDKVVINGCPIENVYFVENNTIACLTKNRNNSAMLLLVDLGDVNNGNNSDKIYTINPVQNAVAIEVLTGKKINYFVTISGVPARNGGVSRVAHRIDISHNNGLLGFSMAVLPPSQFPLEGFYDAAINPIIYYANFNGTMVDVFIADRNNNIFSAAQGRNFSDANYLLPFANVPNHSQQSQIHGTLLERINDFRCCYYLSANRSFCYKLFERNQRVKLQCFDLRTHEETNHTIPKISRLADCKINLDSNGNPQYAAIITNNGSRIENIPLLKNRDVAIINRKFNGFEWERLDISVYGSVWLIQVTDPKRRQKLQKTTGYYLYHIKSRKFDKLFI